ncbi:MAG: hypothetical protein ACXWCO_00765 [Caldimonas sp.]
MRLEALLEKVDGEVVAGLVIARIDGQNVHVATLTSDGVARLTELGEAHLDGLPSEPAPVDEPAPEPAAEVPAEPAPAPEPAAEPAAAEPAAVDHAQELENLLG